MIVCKRFAVAAAIFSCLGVIFLSGSWSDIPDFPINQITNTAHTIPKARVIGLVFFAFFFSISGEESSVFLTFPLIAFTI
jgi:hypothetical protein